MEAVTRTFELQLVPGEADLVDLDGGQGIGGVRRFADQHAELVVAELIKEVAVAQKERLADKHCLELIFGNVARWLFGRLS